VDTGLSVQAVDTSLADLKGEILAMRFQLHRLHLNSTQSAEILEENAIKQHLDSSENIISSASEYLGSAAGTIRDDQSIVEFGPGKAALVEGWIDDTRSDKSHDSATDNELESERDLISELGIIANEKFSRRDYVEARRFFSKFMERAKKHDTWETREIHEAQLKLAICLTAQREFRKADELLNSVNSSTWPMDQQARLHQYRAEILFMLSNFSAANSLAKLAMRGQRRARDDAGYHNALSLLAKISRLLGETEEATVYERRLPTNFTPTRIPGWGEPAAVREQPRNRIEDTSNKPSVFVSYNAAQKAASPTSPQRAPKPQTVENSRPTQLPPPSAPVSTANPLKHTMKFTEQMQLTKHKKELTSVCFSPGGRIVATSSLDGTIKCWDHQSGKLERNISVGTERMGPIAFSPSGARLAITTSDGYLRVMRVWGWYQRKELAVYRCERLSRVVWEDESRIVYLEDGKIARRYIDTGNATDNGVTYQELPSWLPKESAALSSSGKLLAAGPHQGTVYIYDVSGREAVRTGLFRATPDRVIAMVFSPRDMYIALSFEDVIFVYTTKYGQLVARRSISHPLTDIAFSSDNSLLLSSYRDGCFRVWSIRDESLQLTVHSKATLTCIAYSDDDETLVCGDAQGSITVFDVERKILI
jgi:WD40 repeat protein